MKTLRWLLKQTYSWISPSLGPRRFLHLVPAYWNYFRQWRQYQRLPGAEPMRLVDARPFLFDRTQETPVDMPYFYQSVWATQRIAQSRPSYHIDIGSEITFIGLLTVVTQVAFVDLRPPEVNVSGLSCVRASILDLPFADESISSLSCLHVAEHIGLGRYGDPLDPCGMQKATKELSRVLAPGGNLYFSAPVGQPRVCFNAHRIHTPAQILEYFADLELVEFSGVDDQGEYFLSTTPDVMAQQSYSCGLFWLRK